VAEFSPGMILKAVRLERTQRLEAKSRGTSGEAEREQEREKRMALLLFFVQDSKPTIMEYFYFLL
jgi:hypothetical protein